MPLGDQDARSRIEYLQALRDACRRAENRYIDMQEAMTGLLEGIASVNYKEDADRVRKEYNQRTREALERGEITNAHLQEAGLPQQLSDRLSDPQWPTRTGGSPRLSPCRVRTRRGPGGCPGPAVSRL